jgi:hypothetical protein
VEVGGGGGTAENVTVGVGGGGNEVDPPVAPLTELEMPVKVGLIVLPPFPLVTTVVVTVLIIVVVM